MYVCVHHDCTSLRQFSKAWIEVLQQSNEKWFHAHKKHVQCKKRGAQNGAVGDPTVKQGCCWKMQVQLHKPVRAEGRNFNAHAQVKTR